MIKRKIEEYCSTLGLNNIGFIKCRRFDELEEFFMKRKELGLENEFEENELEKRLNPKVYMEEGKTIITIAFPYIWDNSNNENGFSKYTKGYDYHKVVKSYLDNICEYISSLNGSAIPLVDSNSLPERYIAYLGGVGFIGRNNMIITKEYGSYVFLGEIITDLDIECGDANIFKEISTYKQCGECKKCIENCPTKSISLKRINPNICSSYITQKKDLSKTDIKLIKGKVFGCDICQDVCPYNQNVKESNIEMFKPLEFMDDDIKVYADINNKFFKESIARTSCGWRGKNVIKRNAIIKLYEQGENISIYRGKSPYIDEYIDKIIEIE